MKKYKDPFYHLRDPIHKRDRDYMAKKGWVPSGLSNPRKRWMKAKECKISEDVELTDEIAARINMGQILFR